MLTVTVPVGTLNFEKMGIGQSGESVEECVRRHLL